MVSNDLERCIALAKRCHDEKLLASEATILSMVEEIRELRKLVAHTYEGQPPWMSDPKPRCVVCGWPLARNAAEGCVDGNCSERTR